MSSKSEVLKWLLCRNDLLSCVETLIRLKSQLTTFWLVEAELDGKKDTLSIDIIHAEIMLQLDSACQRQWLVSPGSTHHVGWEVVNWADYEPVTVVKKVSKVWEEGQYRPVSNRLPSTFLLIILIVFQTLLQFGVFYLCLYFWFKNVVSCTLCESVWTKWITFLNATYRQLEYHSLRLLHV